MKRRTILASTFVVAALAAAPAVGGGELQPKNERAVACGGHSHGGHSPKGANALARQGWDASKLKKRGGRIEKVRHLSRCPASKNAARHVEDVIDGARKRFKRARARAKEADALTPFDCGGAGRWAIPCAIVACESGYRWNAYNPSGARGPYQFLGWPVPWPVRSEADRLAHHRMAAKLWNGGAGRSHWVCPG